MGFLKLSVIQYSILLSWAGFLTGRDMPLLTLRDVHIDFGARALLQGVNFSLEKGRKYCLLGRNGQGKSTLLKFIAGEIPCDAGERILSDGVRIAMMQQFVPEGIERSVREHLTRGLGEVGEALWQHAEALARGDDQTALQRWQPVIERHDGWSLLNRVEAVISRLGLHGDAHLSQLSGGNKRKVNLAQALLGEPDVLLLDEPTNHLDIEAILWLQKYIASLHCAVVFVTHDRAFLRAVADAIVELDRGQLHAYDCNYDTYLRRREQRLEAEAAEWARLDKKLSEEEIWVRQGIKARRTRARGRVNELERLRNERRQRRTREKQASAEVNLAEASGKKVIVAHKLNFAYGGHTLVRDFSTRIFRGDKVGIIGPNGVGKTTLVRLLTGQLQPDSGSVKLGTQLHMAHFDQLRDSLNLDDTVQNNLQLGSDEVLINGRARHVISYLQDFLFSADKIRGPASVLSGGERSRLLLARLFARPANVLILDEPTNDLDMETLDMLEDLLFDFNGTVLLISHDRDFIDRIATQTLVFAGDGRIEEYVGGYSDYLRQRPREETSADNPAEDAGATTAHNRRQKKSGLSYKYQRELNQLPGEIEALEAKLEALNERMCAADFYQQDGETIQQVSQQVKTLQDELAQKYARWERLEGMRDDQEM